MTCTCVRNVNRQLRLGDSQLKTMTPRDERGRCGAPRVLVRVEFTNPSTRRRLPIAVATHCPFCGTRYKD